MLKIYFSQSELSIQHCQSRASHHLLQNYGKKIKKIIIEKFVALLYAFSVNNDLFCAEVRA